MSVRLCSYQRDTYRTCMRIGRENPDLVKIGLQYWALHAKTQVRFIVAGEIKSPRKCCFQLEWSACISAAFAGWISMIFDIGDFYKIRRKPHI